MAGGGRGVVGRLSLYLGLTVLRGVKEMCHDLLARVVPNLPAAFLPLSLRRLAMRAGGGWFEGGGAVMSTLHGALS